jgi:serine/threonine protein kinase
MPVDYGGWEIVSPLGEGGQSTVSLVRSPQRVTDRKKSLDSIRTGIDQDKRAELAEAVWSYARPDVTSELGALKVFKIPPVNDKQMSPPPNAEDSQGVERLRNEIHVLNQNRPGLPQLLAFNEDQRWIITELFPNGSLEKNITMYRGKVRATLIAFRSLVTTVASLHDETLVHRDIKPANVFVRAHEHLALGDFGIVFNPHAESRLTQTNERVGPRDYMPPWAHTGMRFDQVEPTFDVYMLGKLLWSMVAGKIMLPREYHRRSEFDLEQLFPRDRHMRLVNSILDQCLVELPSACLKSGRKLLDAVDECIDVMERSLPQGTREGLELPCRVCGRGVYKFHRQVQVGINDEMSRLASPIHLRLYICSVCTNYQLFAPGYPDEAIARDWKPLN